MRRESETHRSGFVAVVGRPNIGKSTLFNALLGRKLSIVTPVAQTTRKRLLAVHQIPGAQLLLLDTPGIHDGPKALNRLMAAQIQGAIADADVVVLMTGLSRSEKKPAGWLLDPEDLSVAERLDAAGKPIVAAINKIDRLPSKSHLLPAMERLAAIRCVRAVVPISAIHGDGIGDLLREVTSLLPEGPPLYPEDMLTDEAERFFVAEIVREAVIRETTQELPHSTAVTIASFKTGQDGAVTVHADIHVEKTSQRAILIGRKGEKIKAIGTRAREDATAFLGTPVHLFLHVVVTRNWSKDPRRLEEMGYV